MELLAATQAGVWVVILANIGRTHVQRKIARQYKPIINSYLTIKIRILALDLTTFDSNIRVQKTLALVNGCAAPRRDAL